MSSRPHLQSADALASKEESHIAVVIPCYKVETAILAVLARIGPEVSSIVCVDDACPNGSGKLIAEKAQDHRVKVIFHERNTGVGGATITGFRAALESGADIIVKIDGDGQMDPSLIPRVVRPIKDGRADYTKGNRFFSMDDVKTMPGSRVFGNALLSFMSKLSSGYWDVFDPTNGFIAVHHNVLRHVPLNKVSRRFFFESDMLFRLNVIRAVVIDIPMTARYGAERSNLRIAEVLLPFLGKHLANLSKRVIYNYFLRDFSIASLELLFGAVLLLWGLAFGAHAWVNSAETGQFASAGTVMLAALPVLIGLQLLLGFLNYDIRNVPRSPIQRLLS